MSHHHVVQINLVFFHFSFSEHGPKFAREQAELFQLQIIKRNYLGYEFIETYKGAQILLEDSSASFSCRHFLTAISAVLINTATSLAGAIHHLQRSLVRINRHLVALAPSIHRRFADVGQGFVALAFLVEGGTELFHFGLSEDSARTQLLSKIVDHLRIGYIGEFRHLVIRPKRGQHIVRIIKEIQHECATDRLVRIGPV